MDIGSTLFVNLLRQQQMRTAQAEASQKQDSSQIEQQYYKDMSNLQGLMEKSRKAEADWYEREIEQAKKRGEMAGRLGQAAPNYDDPEYSRAAMLGQQEGSLKKQEDDAKKAKIAAELGIKTRNVNTQERHAKVSEGHLGIAKNAAGDISKLRQSQTVNNLAGAGHKKSKAANNDMIYKAARIKNQEINSIQKEIATITEKKDWARTDEEKIELVKLQNRLTTLRGEMSNIVTHMFRQGNFNPATPVAENTGTTSTEGFTDDDYKGINEGG